VDCLPGRCNKKRRIAFAPRLHANLDPEVFEFDKFRIQALSSKTANKDHRRSLAELIAFD
jgi:hypothetical protein